MTTLRLTDSELHDASVDERAIELSSYVGGRTVARPAVLEYRVIYVARSMAGQPNEGVEEDLNKAAQEGWRLVGSLTSDEARTTGLILEREAQRAGIA